MKILLLLIIITISSFIFGYATSILFERIEKNCNHIGGSYLGGHCIRNL